jgi:D-psicose/D-tagatose/L-ribulose 3-epimerase
VAGLGFDTLEICVEDPVRVSADAVRRAAAEAGVTIAVCGAFGSDRDASHEEPSRRRIGIDYLNRLHSRATHLPVKGRPS